VLNREQRQLADLGETLSPARVYGYGAGNAGRASSTEEQSGSDGSGSGSDFSSDDEILRFSNGDSEALGGGGGGECGRLCDDDECSCLRCRRSAKVFEPVS
jgi:hypothetical protein